MAGSCPKVVILVKPRLLPRSGLRSSNKHSLEEELLHLATSTSKVTPVQFASLLRGLPTLAKPPLYCGWKGTLNKCHCPSNDTSTIRKATFSDKAPSWITLGKLEATYKFVASLFCSTHSLHRTILDHGRSSLSQSCNSYEKVAVEIWAQMDQLTSSAWKNSSLLLHLR